VRGAIVACVLAIAVVTACLVNKRSVDFACETDNDCDLDRVCQDSHCVIGFRPPIDGPPLPDTPDAPECPFVSGGRRCTSCDLVAQTCQVDCSNGGCGGMTCPVGFACTFICTKANACNSINCTDAASCDIQCSGNNACDGITCGAGACQVTCATMNACDNVTCGTGACNVTCGATGSCGNVQCPDSCKCDVSCPTGNCTSMTCPMPGGMFCTDNAMANGQCSSTPTGCATCP
jgi:hypothetical protein